MIESKFEILPLQKALEGYTGIPNNQFNIGLTTTTTTTKTNDLAKYADELLKKRTAKK